MHRNTSAPCSSIRKAWLYTLLVLWTLALSLSLTEKQAFGQDDAVRFAHSKIEFIAYPSLDEAFQAANEHYEGRLLVYFYNSASLLSQTTEREIFGDDSLSALVNSHFARYAIDAHSDVAKQLLEEHSYTWAHDGPSELGEPLLLFLNRRYEGTFTMRHRLKASYTPEESAKIKAWIVVWRDAAFMADMLPDREFGIWMEEAFQRSKAGFE